MRTSHFMAAAAALVVVTATVMAEESTSARNIASDNDFLKKYAETRGFSVGRPVRARPAPDGKTVLFLRAQPPSPKLNLFEFDVAKKETRQLLTAEAVLKGGEEKLSPEEKARRERMRISSGGFTDFQMDESGKQVLLSLSGKLYLLTRDTGKVTELATGPGSIIDPKFRPDGGAVGYVRDQDVYVYDLATGKEQAVTSGGTEKKSHGVAEFVAQEEMGRFSGWWWSPDGKKIAYEEADADGVKVWYVADPFRPDGKPQPFYYPRPGKANVKVRLGIVAVAGGDTTWVDWDAKAYEYLANVRWDEKGPLTITVQDRSQQQVALLRVNPANGKTTELVHEKDAPWIDLHQDMPRWLKDGSFLWTAPTADGPQLERHAPDGALRTVLVLGSLDYRGLDAVLEDRDVVICQTGKDPTTAFVARFSLSHEAKQADWFQPGTAALQTAAFNKAGSLYVLTSTTVRHMARSRVFDAKNNEVGELPSVAEKPPFEPNVVIEKIGNGGEEFYSAIIRPRNFDAKKRYPVLLHVYGGPTALMVQTGMSGWLLPQWLADQGFIVVSIDNRGTPYRGRSWERAIYGKFGTVPLEDQQKGLRLLGQMHPELDLERVGVYGWSFGGYLSALCVLKPGTMFKCAIAGAPVVDWEDYDTHYTERYLGLPKDNAAAYREASLLTYAKDLDRPLLLVHGTADDNVYFRHTLKLADAVFRAGKVCEVLPLAGLTHRGPAVVPQYLYARHAQFFHKHLGEPEERTGSR